MKTFEGITAIVSRVGYTISASGEITTAAEDVVKEGSTLKIGASSSSRGNTIMSFGNFSSSSFVSDGESSMTLNDVEVRTSGNTMYLTGPSNKILVVNGVRTTFGGVRSGGSAAAEPVRPRETYSLAGNTLLRNLTVSGRGECKIDGKFLHDLLVITISGSGSVQLPARTFSNLTLTISGSGDISGNDEADGTKTFDLSATVSGSGDISGIVVLDQGSVQVSGSGDISIEALDPDKIARSSAGSGRIRVRRTTASLSDLDKTTTPTSSGKKRARTDDDSVVKREKKESSSSVKPEK